MASTGIRFSWSATSSFSNGQVAGMCNWVDVATTSIPRRLTERCIGSLLESMDASGYRLRWVLHLDWRDELAAMWQDTLSQIHHIAPRFDDALIMISYSNQGFGRSCLRVLRELRHDTLWIEDDWLWVRQFCLRDVESAARDGFHFYRPRVRMGATTPGFWRFHTVEFLRDHYPDPPESATENHFKRILTRQGQFRNNRSMGKVPRNTHTELGKQVLADLGMTHNFFGVALEPYIAADAAVPCQESRSGVPHYSCPANEEANDATSRE